MKAVFYFAALVFFPLLSLYGQKGADTLLHHHKRYRDTGFIKSFDTVLHVQSWVSTNSMDYTLVYDEDFKLVVAPNQTNTLSFGFSYRYLDLGFGFSPRFLNSGQDEDQQGESEQFGIGTSFSVRRFNLSVNYSSVKGFYLKNSNEFTRASLPDTPYVLYPDLAVRHFNLLLRYNVNPNFSTAALVGGTQIQRRSALTFLPSFQFARFRFHDGSANSEVKNEYTYSTDLYLLLPVAGTLVISPQLSASLGVGPSIGVDFYKSISLDDSSKLVLSKGTKGVTGYNVQAAISWHPGRFFAGVETRYRTYGHKIEDISRLIKQYSYFQLFIGWRFRPPGFAKKSLDWANKVSPVKLD